MKILALALLAAVQMVFWAVRLRKMRLRHEALREDWYQAVARAERRRAEMLADFPRRCPQCGHAVPERFLEHEQLGGIFGGGTLTACRHCLYGEDYP
jgi:hypothetical protein